MASPKPRLSGLYTATIARFLGWCAVFMTAASALGVLQGRARSGNAVGMLIFGIASFFLLKAARIIRADSFKPPEDAEGAERSGITVGAPKQTPTLAQSITMVMMIMAVCSFVIVIAHGWVTHALPSSRMVLFFALLGMTVVGAVAGLIVSALANILFRLGRPALRVPLTFVAWAAFIGAVTALLSQAGGDPMRLLSLIGIAAFCGMLVGPYYAELFVGLWFLRRN